MSIELLTILLFVAVLLTFASGTPVGFGLGGISMAMAAFTCGPQAFRLISSTATLAFTSFILLSIPPFLFMGQRLVRSGLGEAMFQAAYLLSGRIRGGRHHRLQPDRAMVGIIGTGDHDRRHGCPTTNAAAWHNPGAGRGNAGLGLSAAARVAPSASLLINVDDGLFGGGDAAACRR